MIVVDGSIGCDDGSRDGSMVGRSVSTSTGSVLSGGVVRLGMGNN